jgi:hypothetical protein
MYFLSILLAKFAQIGRSRHLAAKASDKINEPQSICMFPATTCKIHMAATLRMDCVCLDMEDGVALNHQRTGAHYDPGSSDFY